MSILKDLVSKSKLDIVSCAYADLLDWEEQLTDKRIIEEIEYKLYCAIDNYNSSSSDDYNEKDFILTKNFIKLLKKIQKAKYTMTCKKCGHVWYLSRKPKYETGYKCKCSGDIEIKKID